MRRRMMPLNRVLPVRAAIAQCRPDRIALSVSIRGVQANRSPGSALLNTSFDAVARNVEGDDHGHRYYPRPC